MKKCTKFHLHIHSDAHSMLIAITIMSYTCKSRRNWAHESMQREIWKDSTGYTVPIWNSSVSISLAALVSSLCLLQEHHMSRSSRNMLNYWSGADTSQSLDTNSNCIHGPPGPAGWWPIPSDTVLAAVNTRGMRRGGGLVDTDRPEDRRCVKNSYANTTIQEWDVQRASNPRDVTDFWGSERDLQARR